MKKRLGLSVAQQVTFRPIVRAAWLRNCLVWNHDHKDRKAERAWYEKELFSATGVHSTTELDASADTFHDLLLHFATLAQDRALICRLATENERRVRWLIQRCLAELSFLECRSVEWSYAVATFNHMRLPLKIDDTPRPYLEKVFMALDTHVRRTLDVYNQRNGRSWTRRDLRAAVEANRRMEIAYAS